jgi:hypothetical protein
MPAAVGAAPAAPGQGLFSFDTYGVTSLCPAGSPSSASSYRLQGDGINSGGNSAGTLQYAFYDCNNVPGYPVVQLTCVYVVQDTAYASGPDTLPGAAPGSYVLLHLIASDKTDQPSTYGIQVVPTAPPVGAQECGARTVKATSIAMYGASVQSAKS